METVFNRFEDINHLPLRVFNRVVFLNNLLADAGEVAARHYIGTFNEGERKQLFLMQSYIKLHGIDKARKDVTKNLEVVYDTSEE